MKQGQQHTTTTTMLTAGFPRGQAEVPHVHSVSYEIRSWASDSVSQYKVFTREEMTAVTPMQMRNWMCMKAFGEFVIESTN
jgi:hypothetical protein